MDLPDDVLVVDDDQDMVEAMLMVLEDSGYRTRRAENGRQALEAVAARRPAVVLLDVLMPVMDGSQCARELRARYGRSLPIVIVTAAEHLRTRCEPIEADAVLPKPFDIADLLNVVARFVPAHGAERLAVRS
jgi:CheY-like chemotaxis protein